MFRFVSLEHPDTTAYLVQKAPDFSTRNRYAIGVAEWAFQYDTYGDGLIQHACEIGVPLERMGDFLASLTTHLLSVPHDVEETVKYWPTPELSISYHEVRFLLNLHYDLDKTRYFNLDEGKVSSSESKRHDKRWAVVPEWANGTLGTVYGLKFCCPAKMDWRDLLTRALLYKFIKEAGR